MVSPEGDLLAPCHQQLVRELVIRDEAVETVVQAVQGSMYGANSSTGTPVVGASAFCRACAVLTLFAQVEANRVAHSGGFQVLFDGMTQYSLLEDVQECAMVALVELGRRTDCNSPIVANTLAGAVVGGMEKHAQSGRIFYLGSKCLRLTCQLCIRLEDEVLVIRGHSILMDGIFRFLLEDNAREAGVAALVTLVGPNLAQDMIRYRATILCTVDRILRTAVGRPARVAKNNKRSKF